MLTDKEFERRLVEHQDYLLRYAHTLCKTSKDYEAEDLLQDTNLRAWEKRYYYKTDNSITGWLCFMMHNIFINHVLKSRIKIYREDSDTTLVPIIERHSTSSHINSGEGNITLDHIDTAINSLLNPIDRDIVQRYISGESHGHIGTTYNMKDNTVKQRYFHAIKIVREELRGKGIEFENYITTGTKNKQAVYRKKQALMEYKIRKRLDRQSKTDG